MADSNETSASSGSRSPFRLLASVLLFPLGRLCGLVGRASGAGDGRRARGGAGAGAGRTKYAFDATATLGVAL